MQRNMTVMLDEDLVSGLDTVASQERVGRSAVVRWAIEQYLVRRGVLQAPVDPEPIVAAS